MRIRSRAWFIRHGVATGSLDKTGLIYLIGVAQSLDSADYTPASWAVLDDAYQDGMAVLANEAATQPEINNAANAIQSAIESLVLDMQYPILLADGSYIDLGGNAYLMLAGV